MEKCNYDCFNCEFKDCVENTISKKERNEIKERDKRYFDLATPSHGKARRAKLRHNR